MPTDPTQTELPPSPGDRVGQWLLGEPLGMGGMATVYAATGPEGKEVAVKVLHPGKGDQEEGRRFQREFITLRGLRHPAIVSVFEAGQAGNYPWIAMERIPGTDLETLIRRWEATPPSNRHALAEGIFRDICQALAHVHSTGLIHRDLKPSNVLITPTYRAKLTDFGVVKATFGQFQTQLTAVGSLVGTAAYMSPEQISGEPVDGRSDLYSLGAVLYVLLTGQRPIVADSLAGYLARHLNATPRDPRELDAHVPARLAQICLRLLAKDPAHRYASAELVIEALNEEDDEQTQEAYGREPELAKVVDLLRALQAGHGNLAVIRGPAGSGRSTFLRKIAEQARASGVGTSLASASEPDLLERLCAQIPSLGLAGQAAGAVDRIAARTRGRAWTLLVDDLDEAQPEALTDLSRLLRQQVTIEGEPILLVASARSLKGAVSTFASGATTSISPSHIELHSLSTDATERVLRDLGLTGAACTILSQRIVAAGEAWPQSIADRVDALTRDGWLSRDIHGTLHLQRSLDDLRSETLPIPQDSRDDLVRSVSTLETTERILLDTLAVLGGESVPHTLEAVTQLAGPEIERGIQGLIRAGFATEETVGVHRLIRLQESHPCSVVYELIEEANRIRLHRAVAKALRGRRGRTPLDTIAKHLLGGGQPAEAYPLLLRGAAAHLRAGRLPDARALLDDAGGCQDDAELLLQMEARVPLRREFATLEAEYFEQLGDESRALEAWTRAHSAAQTEGNTDAARKAQAGIGVMYAALEDRRAVRILAPVWKTMPRGAPQWPKTTKALARAFLAAGRTLEAKRLWERLQSHARDTGLGRLAAEAQLGLARVQLATGSASEAREALHNAELLLRSAGAHATALADCVLQLAYLAHARGALLAATERAGEVLRTTDATALQKVQARSLLVHCADAEEGILDPTSHLDALLNQAIAHTHPDRTTWLTRISAARALLTVERAEDALGLVSADQATIWAPLDDAHAPGLTDPSGQVQALRSRLTSDPDLATAEAWSALGRVLPADPWASARIAIDASHGLLHAGDPSAEDAILEALERTSVPELVLLRLEAACLGARIGLVPAEDLEALRQQVIQTTAELRTLGTRWM